MFNFIRNIFCKPRLIERFKTLKDIQIWHNKLLSLHIDIADEMSPEYLCYRNKVILDSEQKAVKAYWKNKPNKYDLWRENTASTPTMADSNTDKANMPTAPQDGAQPPPTALNGTVQESIPAAEVVEQLQEPQETAANVIEIHINK